MGKVPDTKREESTLVIISVLITRMNHVTSTHKNDKKGEEKSLLLPSKAEASPPLTMRSSMVRDRPRRGGACEWRREVRSMRGQDRSRGETGRLSCRTGYNGARLVGRTHL